MVTQALPINGVPSSVLLDGIHEVSAYNAPTVDLGSRESDRDEWSVIVFFLALAIAYAVYCTSQGGDATITARLWPPSFRVTCDMP